MSNRVLFMVSPSGELTPMQPSAPANEDDLQQLIAIHPQLICTDGEQLLLIEREAGIADSADSGARWSLDHLFVNQFAVPILVEVKRAVDSRLRREVVGQMMDYAANSIAYWPAGAIRQRFESLCRSEGQAPTEALNTFLGEDSAFGEDAFWDAVEQNLRDGRVKLVFVADKIPDELARIVEFMNEQMRADVRAVELNYFEGNGVKTLAPRIIGETERTKAEKPGSRSKLPALSEQEWIEQHISRLAPSIASNAHALLAICRALGLNFRVVPSQGSIAADLALPNGQSVTLIHLTNQGKGYMPFGAYAKCSGLADEALRQRIYQEVGEVVGALSSSKHADGYPSFSLAALQTATHRQRLEQILASLIESAKTNI